MKISLTNLKRLRKLCALAITGSLFLPPNLVWANATFTAIRSIAPATYSPTVPVTVSVVVTPDPVTTVNYAVEDLPPTGWAVTNISPGGSWAGAGQTVKWGPLFDQINGNLPRTFTYQATPPAGETGSKTFAGIASFDGTNVALSGTSTINPAVTNSAPVAANQSATTNEDTAKAIILSATDPDAGQTLSYSTMTAPTHGTLTGTIPNLTYTPTANYSGPDSFTFKAFDGFVFSNIATISMTITAVNDAPVANAQGVATNLNTAKAITLTGSDIEGSALTYSVVASPTHGTLSGTAPSLTYTPASNYSGADSFTFKVNDGTVDSAVATISITVNNTNTAPVASNQSLTTNEDTAKAIVLSATDVNGQTLTYTVVASPTKGILSGTAPNLTYTPNLNANGTDSFTFKANDGLVDSNIATISMTITAVNDAPVANAQGVATNLNTAKAITLTGSDIEGSALTYSVVASPTHGTLSGTAPALTYTPANNYSGADSFTFKVNDGTVDSAVATISITVNNTNTAPVASNQSLTTAEDTAKAIVLSATDVNGQTLTYTVVSSPTKGVLSGTAPNLTYTPNLNANGADSFTFKANDGLVDSNIATISLTITAVNDAPVANAQSISTNLNTAKAITLTGSDIEGSALTYSVVASPTHGTLSGTAPALTYTPASNYSGADSFTFKANDGTVDSAVATISITVNNTNTAPVASNQSLTTAEDTAKAIVLSATDVNGQTLTYTVVSSPTKGVLSGTAPNLTYTPNLNANGADSFTFKANDGLVDSNIATISLTITAVNDAPVANAQSISTNLNIAKAITLTGSDIEGSALTYSVVASPTHGTLSGTAPALTYTPASNYSGADSFTFKVNDGTVDSAVATISITVNNTNTAPVASNQSLTTAEDTAKAIVLSATDVNGQTLTYTVVSSPTKGVLSGTAPNLTYTPNLNANGTDSFTFKANDGLVDSNIATISMTITAVNDAPVANAQGVATNLNTAKAITLTGSDIEGSALTYSVVASPTHGTLSGTAPSLTYTPASNYSGADSFTFKVNDGTVDSAVATISITVNNTNTAPVASNQSLTTNEDTAKAIVLSATDVNGQTLTHTVVAAPTKGILSGTAPNLTYTPNLNANGADSFTFKANDGLVDSNIATISLTITAVNDAPLANAQGVATNLNTAKAITLTGSDIEGSALTYSVVASPTHGTLSGTAPALTYTPANNYSGADSFTFKANDGTVDSAVATISITVNNTNTAPVASNQSLTTAEDTAKAIVLSATDVNGQTLTYTVVTSPTKGILSGTAPNLTYTPNLNANGTDSFTFKANDGLVDSNIATISMTITAVNDAPVANAQGVATNLNTAKAITLTGSDIEGSALTYSVVASPTHGTLSGTAPSLTYTPANNYSGADSFTFKTNDGLVDSNIATISITVNNTNQTPTATPQTVTVIEDTPKAITLSGVDLDGNPLTYTVVTTPVKGTLSGTGPNLTYTPNANNTLADNFTFKVNDGLVDSAVATVSITMTPMNDAPLANVQNVQTNMNTAKAITLTGSDIEGSALTYVAVTQPMHGTLSGSGASLTYTPAAAYSGADSFNFKANDGALDSNIATISITVTNTNQAPVVNAGIDQTITLPASVNLSGTVTDDGLPTGSLTSSWSKVSGLGTVTFGNASSKVTTASFSTSGSYTLRLMASDSVLTTTDDIVITVNPAPPVNQAPVVNAGIIQTITLPSLANLSGTVTDDGLPTGSLTSSWSKFSGPGTVTFGNASLLNTTASFSTSGSYTLRLTATDGVLTTTNDIVITVNPAPSVNQAPGVNAGVDQTITLPSGVNLSGLAADDGLPTTTLTATWTAVSGPGSVSFGNANLMNTTANFSSAGSYMLRLRVSDSWLSAADDVMITVNDAPVGQAPTFALTVLNGTGSGQFAVADIVTITANAPASGKVFDQWTGAGVTNPMASVTTLSMPNFDISVTATYKTAPKGNGKGSGWGHFKNAINPTLEPAAISYSIEGDPVTTQSSAAQWTETADFSSKHVQLTVLDRNGSEVIKLEDGDRAPGSYTLSWDGRNTRNEIVASGVYILMLKIENHVETKKLIIMK